MTTRQLTVLLALGVLWGASFLFIKVIVNAGVGPTGLSAARTGLGFATILPFAWLARSKMPRDRRTWLIICGLGVLNFALPWTLFALALEHAPSGASSIANASQPLWSAIFAVPLLKAERLSGLKTVGLLTGFSGVLVLMGPDILDAGSTGSTAILIMIVATMCYGVSGVLIRRHLPHVPAVALAGGQIGTATVILWPIALVTGAFSSASLGPGEWGSLVTLGVLGSGAGVVAFMWLIFEVGPVRASVVTYLMPPIGVFLGWLVLGEAIGWSLVGGLALVVTGVALVQGVPIGRWLPWTPARVPVPAASSD